MCTDKPTRLGGKGVARKLIMSSRNGVCPRARLYRCYPDCLKNHKGTLKTVEGPQTQLPVFNFSQTLLFLPAAISVATLGCSIAGTGSFKTSAKVSRLGGTIGILFPKTVNGQLNETWLD